MSLELALIEWIINTLQPFVVVEKPSFQRIFKCIQHQLPLPTRDTIRNRITGRLSNRYLSLKEEFELASFVSLFLDE